MRHSPEWLKDISQHLYELAPRMLPYSAPSLAAGDYSTCTVAAGLIMDAAEQEVILTEAVRVIAEEWGLTPEDALASLKRRITL